MYFNYKGKVLTKFFVFNLSFLILFLSIIKAITIVTAIIIINFMLSFNLYQFFMSYFSQI